VVAKSRDQVSRDADGCDTWYGVVALGQPTKLVPATTLEDTHVVELWLERRDEGLCLRPRSSCVLHHVVDDDLVHHHLRRRGVQLRCGIVNTLCYTVVQNHEAAERSCLAVRSDVGVVGQTL